MTTAAAILVSDLHLSPKPPVARSCEEDWLKVQRRYLKQLEDLTDRWHCPILCAGDVLDRWNVAPEFINWLIDHLPVMFVIPGNHDLPLHNYHDFHKSALWTLYRAGCVKILSPGEKCVVNGIEVYGFPYGCKLCPPGKSNAVKLALIHRYIWFGNNFHVGADPEANLNTVSKELTGYDVACFGDNHKGFLCVADKSKGRIPILNCGTFIRRTIDEKEYKPAVGILHHDGTIERHYLNVEDDQFEDRLIVPLMQMLDGGKFIKELLRLDKMGLDFSEHLRRFAMKADTHWKVKEIILQAVENNE